MIQKLYSLFDRKAQNFGAPMMFVNDEVCRRAILSVVMGDNEIKNYPGDFDVFWCGVFDTDGGHVAIPDVSAPSLVFNVGDLVAAAKEAGRG